MEWITWKSYFQKKLPFFVFFLFLLKTKEECYKWLYLCPWRFVICFAELYSSYESLWDDPISSFPGIQLLSPTIVGLYHLQDEGSPMSCWKEIRYFIFNMFYFSRKQELPIMKRLKGRWFSYMKHRPDWLKKIVNNNLQYIDSSSTKGLMRTTMLRIWSREERQGEK